MTNYITRRMLTILYIFIPFLEGWHNTIFGTKVIIVINVWIVEIYV